MILWNDDFNPNVIRGEYMKRSHCRRGHLYTEKNTYRSTVIRKDKTYTVRICRQCRSLRDRKRIMTGSRQHG